MNAILNPECEFLVTIAKSFLWTALLVAAAGVIADLATKLVPLLRKQGYPAVRSAAPADPIKLIDALKALVEALTKAPAWIAMFLAGAGLLWMAYYAAKDVCKYTPAQVAAPMSAERVKGR